MIRLKICGMRDVKNIRDAASLRPDYIGFILYKGSPRYVGENFVMPDFMPSVKKVGVFVNESTEVMMEKASMLKLDYLQLHGKEPARQCEELKKQGMKVIKVFSVDDGMDFKETKDYHAAADYFLFDTKGKFYGGNARMFSWNILERYDQRIPFFLSGGIGPENISGIKNLKNMNLHAIDVNSGVEISPGLKDIAMIGRIRNILDTNQTTTI